MKKKNGMIYGPKHVKLEYIARFIPMRKNQRVQVWLATPTSSTQQEIESFTATPKPRKSYRDPQGNRIAYNEFIGPALLSLRLKAKIWRSKDVIKENGNHALSRSEYKKYIKSELYLEQTKEIIRLARTITKNSASLPAKIYALTNWIERNFVYRYPVLQRGVRHLDLTKPTGDCGEAGALFVAMCRSLKIPAVNRTGFVMYYNEPSKMYEHGWTSVFTKNLGWIDIDPLAHNISKHGSSYQYVQKNYFLTFSTGFSLPLRPSLAGKKYGSFWWKLGLPYTQNSVQVLQPLFFGSAGKISFKGRLRVE